MKNKILDFQREAIQKAVLDFCNEQKATRTAYVLRKANAQPALEDSDRHAERKEDRLIKAYDDEYFSTFESQDFCDQDRQ